MGDGPASSLRALPRAFIREASESEAFRLPEEERRKMHDVLRLGRGAEIVVLPGDGRAIRCRLDGPMAEPLEAFRPETESPRCVSLALGLPKPESLETAVRMAAELGLAEIAVFPAARSVVRWNESKWASRLKRLESIAREGCEVAFRTRLPAIRRLAGLQQALALPGAQALSEYEAVGRLLEPAMEAALIIGPEGGWTPAEAALIGDRARTLGPRVLRVDTAAAAACALAMLGPVDLPA